MDYYQYVKGLAREESDRMKLMDLGRKMQAMGHSDMIFAIYKKLDDDDFMGRFPEEPDYREER